MQILVVEDEINLACSLVRLLEGQKYRAEAVHDGQSGLEYARSGQFDALILDVMLPGMNGFEIAAALRREGFTIPILMLTAHDEVTAKVRGLDSGADDYLTKPFTTEELLARVRALLRRQATLQMEVVGFGDITLNLNSCMLARENRKVPLSRKEFDVMHILMSAPGCLISKDDLIMKVWGADSDTVDNTVEAYISFLRKKLFYLESRVQITAKRRLGYLLEDRP